MHVRALQKSVFSTIATAAVVVFGLLLAVGCGSKKKTGSICQNGDDCGSGICYQTQCVATCAEQLCGSNRICVLVSGEPLCVPEQNLSITAEAKQTLDVPHYSTEDQVPFPDGWNTAEDGQTADVEQPDSGIEDSGVDVSSPDLGGPDLTATDADDAVAPSDAADVTNVDVALGKDFSGDVIVLDTSGDDGGTDDGNGDDGYDGDSDDATSDDADGSCSELLKPCGGIVVTFDNLGCPLDNNSNTENGVEYHFVNPDNPCQTNDKLGLFIGYSGTLVIDLTALSCTPKTLQIDMTEFTGVVSIYDSIDASVAFATTPITAEIKQTPSVCGKQARRVEIPGGAGYLTEIRVY